VVVDHLNAELIQQLGDVGGVQHLRHRLPQPLGRRHKVGRSEAGARVGLAGAKHGDLVAAGHQRLGQPVHHRLDATVGRRRDGIPRRCDQRDPQRLLRVHVDLLVQRSDANTDRVQQKRLGTVGRRIAHPNNPDTTSCAL
jgi:hypothetical protein